MSESGEVVKTSVWREVFKGVIITAVSVVIGIAGWNVYKSWGVWSGALSVGGDEKPAVVAAVSEQDAAAQVWNCPCAAGLWCQGPRGGVFCMTDTGRKRYAPK